MKTAKAIITNDWDNERCEIVGELITVVSLFECSATAYDVSKMTREEIANFMKADDLEEYAFENDINTIEIEEAIDSGSDNRYCAIQDQSKTPAVVKDVNGVEYYEGGVMSYLNCFGEYWDAVRYVNDNSNIDLAVEEDGTDGGIKIEIVEVDEQAN